MKLKDSIVIAIDFDGTCVEHAYPAIGIEAEGAVETLRELNRRNHRLLLLTMRSGQRLDEAVRWFRERNVTLWQVNTNPEQSTWSSSPKIYADIYIDDTALGCPIRYVEGSQRGVVDWQVVRHELRLRGIL